MFVGEDHILKKIQESDIEKQLIEGEKNNDKNSNSNE